MPDVFELDNFFTALRSVPLWQVLLELLVIGGVVYWVIRFLQGTRGARLLKGIIFLLITLYLGVRLLGAVFDLTRLQVLFDRFLYFAAFAIIIVFQPELRRALMRLGETRLFRGLAQQTRDEIEEILDACSTLSRRRVGALIAVERDVGLGGFTEEATRIDGEVSSELLQTIFWPNTALHDLGVIISGNRIAWAGVQFPLAESGDLPKELGSRHRAAVGLSQESDALVIVVSEETGDISIAERGQLVRKLTIDQLRDELLDRMGQSVSVDAATRPTVVITSSERTRTTDRTPSRSGSGRERGSTTATTAPSRSSTGMPETMAPPARMPVDSPTIARSRPVGSNGQEGGGAAPTLPPPRTATAGGAGGTDANLDREPISRQIPSREGEPRRAGEAGTAAR